MAESLIDQLALDACGNVSVPDLLRKALLVASKLGVAEVPQWINSELTGYRSINDVPPYRIIHGAIMASVAGSRFIPVQFPANELEHTIGERRVTDTVGEIEAMLTRDEDSLRLGFSSEEQAFLQQLFQQGQAQFCCLVNKHKIAGILDAIKNQILQWSIELDRAGVRGEGLSFSIEEKRKANTVTFNANTINVGVAQVGDGNSATSEQRR